MKRKTILVLLISVIAIIFFIGFFDYGEEKGDIFPANLSIAKNGAILDYNLESGEIKEIKINKLDEEGYKMFVYEGFKYEDDNYFVKNPEFIQVLNSELKEIKKYEIPEIVRNTPYIRSITLYKNKPYYLSNSYINEKGQAVSCEFYNDKIECLDGVIDAFVKVNDNKVFSLLDYDMDTQSEYSTLRIRENDVVNDHKLEYGGIYESVSDFEMHQNNYYLLLEKTNDINEYEYEYESYIAMYNNRYELVKIQQINGNSTFYDNMYIRNNIIYLYNEDDTSIMKYDSQTLKHLETISLTKEDIGYSMKQDFREDKLFIYHNSSLTVFDLDDNKVLYNDKLSLPNDYVEPYQVGSVTIKLHEN